MHLCRCEFRLADLICAVFPNIQKTSPVIIATHCRDVHPVYMYVNLLLIIHCLYAGKSAGRSLGHPRVLGSSATETEHKAQVIWYVTGGRLGGNSCHYWPGGITVSMVIGYLDQSLWKYIVVLWSCWVVEYSFEMFGLWSNSWFFLCVYIKQTFIYRWDHGMNNELWWLVCKVII